MSKIVEISKLKIRTVKVSVIIPTYNRADTIKEAIESVISQSPSPNEVIVVDDGSTDDTARILEEFGSKIKVLRQANQGVGAARNLGMLHAEGDWLAFLDSDDVWLPGRLAALQRDLAEAKTDIVAHTGNLFLVGSNYSKDYFETRNWKFPKGSAQLVERSIRYTSSGVFSQTTAVKASCINKDMMFSCSLPIAEDLHLFGKLSLTGNWLFTGDLLAKVRRIEEDSNPLSALSVVNPVAAATAQVHLLESLFERATNKNDKRFLAEALAGALFILASKYSGTNRKKEKSSLLRSIVTHPLKIKAVIKVVIAVLLKKTGYKIILGETMRYR